MKGTSKKISQQSLRQPVSKPQCGTRCVKGKSNKASATFRDGLQPKPEAVRTATPKSSLDVAAGYISHFGNSKRRPE